MSDFDVIVVGSGAAGGAAAWRLCEQGFKVACLDRGDWMDPAQYPSTAPDWERKKRLFANPSISERQAPADYPVDDSASPIAICNFNAVGGSTILYSGHFPRFLEHDFEASSAGASQARWPIRYADLKPYFALNEAEMGVAGLVGDPMYPDIEDVMPPVPLGETGTRLAQAFNAMGWHWWPSYSAIATRARGGRNPCLNLGPCNTGCPQGAKSSTDVTYIPRAQAKGLTVIPNAAVDRVLVEEGRAVGVGYHDADETWQRCTARHVVLAASATGTPRILLNSASETSPNGVANRSGMVGRNLMLHPLGYVEGLFDEAFDVDVGPQGCVFYSHQFAQPNAEDFEKGYMIQVLRGTGPVETAMSALGRRKLRFGPELYDGFEAHYRKQMVVSIVCEDLPDAGNRLTLDPSNADRFGVPGLKVQYTLSDNSKRMLSHGMTRAREMFKVAGAKRSFAFGPVRKTGWHIMGTARMGDDPAQSVVDATGQCHDVPGLSVADSSVFVSSSCVNPANTIQAIALFVADRVAERLRHDG